MNNAPALASNVVPFTRALAWHAAATHVLRTALASAQARGLIAPSAADELLEFAQRGMDTAEVRHTLELVLAKLTTPTEASNATDAG